MKKIISLDRHVIVNGLSRFYPGFQHVTNSRQAALVSVRNHDHKHLISTDINSVLFKQYS